jgi:hypothetical protein
MNHRAHPRLDFFDCAYFAGRKPVGIFPSRFGVFLRKSACCTRRFSRGVVQGSPRIVTTDD